MSNSGLIGKPFQFILAIVQLVYSAGLARNEKDEIAVKEFFESRLPAEKTAAKDFMKTFICIKAIAGMHLSARIFFLLPLYPKMG